MDESDIIDKEPDVLIIVDASWDSALAKIDYMHNSSAFCAAPRDPLVGIRLPAFIIIVRPTDLRESRLSKSAPLRCVSRACCALAEDEAAFDRAIPRRPCVRDPPVAARSGSVCGGVVPPSWPLTFCLVSEGEGANPSLDLEAQNHQIHARSISNSGPGPLSGE